MLLTHFCCSLRGPLLIAQSLGAITTTDARPFWDLRKKNLTVGSEFAPHLTAMYSLSLDVKHSMVCVAGIGGNFIVALHIPADL